MLPQDKREAIIMLAKEGASASEISRLTGWNHLYIKPIIDSVEPTLKEPYKPSKQALDRVFEACLEACITDNAYICVALPTAFQIPEELFCRGWKWEGNVWRGNVSLDSLINWLYDEAEYIYYRLPMTKPALLSVKEKAKIFDKRVESA